MAQWHEVGGTDSSTFNWPIRCITTDTNGNLYATGYFSDGKGYPYVAKWNGSKWSELGASTTNINGYSIQMFIDVNGNIYTIDGNSVNKWNGTAWSYLASYNFFGTFNDNILCGTSDAKGNIYVAGAFHDELTGVRYVEKWDGTSWSPIGVIHTGSNLGYTINSITIDNKGKMYAAGTFVNDNLNPYVAVWNDTAWNQVGGNNDSTFNNYIYNLKIDAIGNLYATGQFTNANGKYYVAKWNGISWSQLGGSNDSTFIIPPNNLTIDNKGNIFVSARSNGSGRDYIEKWDGTKWSEFGSPSDSLFSNAIESITTDANGNIYAAGAFYNKKNYTYVAKYNQSNLLVKLENITASQDNKGITIHWQTSTEINTVNYIIQYSTDGRFFNNIGTVAAIGFGANSYSFTDNNPSTNPLKGAIFYRMESIDKDGSFTYSNVISLTIDYLQPSTFTVYPNPATTYVTIKGNHIATVSLIDNLGKAFQAISLKDATNPTLSVIGLAKGVYHLRIQTTDGKMREVGFIKE